MQNDNDVRFETLAEPGHDHPWHPIVFYTEILASTSTKSISQAGVRVRQYPSTHSQDPNPGPSGASWSTHENTHHLSLLFTPMWNGSTHPSRSRKQV